MYEHPNTQFHVTCREQTNSPAILFINVQNDYAHNHKSDREIWGVGRKRQSDRIVHTKCSSSIQEYKVISAFNCLIKNHNMKTYGRI